MVDLSSRLRHFYRTYYVPHRIEDPTSRNSESYDRALDLWEQLTDNPTLGELTAETLSAYKAALFAYRWRGRPLSARTVRKHLEHVQWILRQAGPRGPRELGTAAGLLTWWPQTRLPRVVESFRPAVPIAHVAALYAAVRAARLPLVEGITAAALWRALLSTMCATSLRIGQLAEAPYAGLRLAERLLILPAGVCRKSKREEPHPLDDRAIADLAAIRGNRELLFPIFTPSTKTAFYNEFHRLRKAAGLPYFTFHDVRRRVITELSASSPAAAQLAAGHSAYRTTQIYQDLDLLGRAVQELDLLGGSQAS